MSTPSNERRGALGAHPRARRRAAATQAAGAGLGLILALGAAGCMGGASLRSTTVGAGSRTAALERRASGASFGYALAGGGGGSYGPDAERVVATSTGATVTAEPAAADDALASYSFADEGAGDSDDGYRGEAPSPASRPPVEATVARLPPEDGSSAHTYADAGEAAAGAGDAADLATDATPGGGALLIYTAGIWLGVYEVRESQATIVARAEALGGFVQHQTDLELTLRVPAARFDELLESVSGVGDLLHREIAADDVSEEYRDVEIRIQNLEAMRQRLEVLLTQATAVEDALRVERELERVTVELERLRGRQRFLSDRIALATVTIHFEARPRDRIDQPEIFALPFYWLQNLGLPNLLTLH